MEKMRVWFCEALSNCREGLLLVVGSFPSADAAFGVYGETVEEDSLCVGCRPLSVEGQRGDAAFSDRCWLVADINLTMSGGGEGAVDRISSKEYVGPSVMGLHKPFCVEIPDVATLWVPLWLRVLPREK